MCLHARDDPDQLRRLGHTEFSTNPPLVVLNVVERVEIDRSTGCRYGTPPPYRLVHLRHSVADANQPIASGTEEPAIPWPGGDLLRARQESHQTCFPLRDPAGHSKPKRARCENVISTMPAMNDVVGPRQLARLEPASQSQRTIGVAPGEGTPHRFDRLDRIEASDRGFLPEATIRSRRRFRTHEIDLMPALAKGTHQHQHRFRGTRPLPIAHELKNLQTRRSRAPGILLRSQCFAYFKNT